MTQNGSVSQQDAKSTVATTSTRLDNSTLQSQQQPAQFQDFSLSRRDSEGDADSCECSPTCEDDREIY